jgi:hypothetical protein
MFSHLSLHNHRLQTRLAYTRVPLWMTPLIASGERSPMVMINCYDAKSSDFAMYRRRGQVILMRLEKIESLMKTRSSIPNPYDKWSIHEQ